MQWDGLNWTALSLEYEYRKLGYLRSPSGTNRLASGLRSWSQSGRSGGARAITNRYHHVFSHLKPLNAFRGCDEASVRLFHGRDLLDRFW